MSAPEKNLLFNNPPLLQMQPFTSDDESDDSISSCQSEDDAIKMDFFYNVKSLIEHKVN